MSTRTFFKADLRRHRLLYALVGGLHRHLQRHPHHHPGHHAQGHPLRRPLQVRQVENFTTAPRLLRIRIFDDVLSGPVEWKMSFF